MKLEAIITQRKTEKSSSYDLVYEWEDVLSSELGLKMIDESGLRQNRWVRRFRVSSLATTNKNAFVFKMGPFGHSGLNKPNIVPYIIDFYLDENQLDWFYKTYNKHKVVFISSKEAYDYLCEHHCPLPIAHLPLSISDKYHIDVTSQYEKKYDLVLMGRQNPVLMDFLEEYVKNHPDFLYAYRVEENGHYYYHTSKGMLIGDIINRDDYIALMRQARVCLYATPGLDGGEERTKGFNQVTPRFLEYLSCLCHVLARYPANSDTDYFEINKFCESVESYEQFEKVMDDYLCKKVDVGFYSNYLQHHYTSLFANDMTKILKDI